MNRRPSFSAGTARAGMAVAAAWAALTQLPFLGKAFHIDETFYLAIARHITVDPMHPVDFPFNWYGWTVPMAALNNNSLFMPYLLAVAMKVTGGHEWAMRLVFLPFDLASAVSLYLLAARLLKRPLMPVLIVLAAPGYMLTMGMLYPEKLTAAFGFFGLYALVRSVEEDAPIWFWASAVCCGAALMLKYFAIFLLPTAAIYCFSRGLSRHRIAGYLGVAAAGLAAYVLRDALSSRSLLTAMAATMSSTAAMPTWNWPYRLRSILSFIGGCGLATAFWPLWAYRPSRLVWFALAAAAAALFLPMLDLRAAVRPLDRVSGFVLSFGALAGLWGFFTAGRRGRGAGLLLPWVISILLVLLCYHAIMARPVMFMLPPLSFSLAETLEARWGAARLTRFYAVSLCAIAALSLALAWVDFRYAETQRAMAQYVARAYPGRRVWCAGHWGLQHYLEESGAAELDLAKGGWDQTRPGDVVVIPYTNSNVLTPRHWAPADVSHITVDESVPLRLISKSGAQAGFYSSIMGFLPFSLSAQPLDQFDVVEISGTPEDIQ